MMNKIVIILCALIVSLTLAFVSVSAGVDVKEIKTPEELDSIIQTEIINKNKVVIVNFFSTQHIIFGTLEPDIFSIVQVKILGNIYEKYSNEVEIIGISYEKNAEKLLPEFIKEYNIKYPVFSTSKEVKNAYGVRGRPTTFIYDLDGNAYVEEKMVPESVIERAIESVLSK